jgi:alginate O-acetyltransferase complex protein AlgI
VLFSSTVFLFQFLPVCLLVYFGTIVALRKQVYANVALVFLSLVFYFIGSGNLVLLLVLSVFANFFIGRTIARSAESDRRPLLAVGVAYNLAILFWFKYLNFAINSFDAAATAFGWHDPMHVVAVALPVGISFYTFMSISYLVDIYRHGDEARSLIHYAAYLSLFPHLVAGPIVRFSELRTEIEKRHIRSTVFVEGIFRFSLGILRKVVIADSLAVQADRIFALPSGDLTPAIAWLGALCYSFQIFYDFAGYTDMAIGLARMLGFHFPENFDQPYSAGSVTKFWRRWHMTLTRWFRDYLYIPLGGNRHGAARTYLNLVLVFFLCGLWHGASWTFVAWGLYHGCILVIERVADRRFGLRPAGFAGAFATFTLVTIGWVFFRSPTIESAVSYIGAMFAIGIGHSSTAAAFGDFFTRSTVFYLIIGAIFAFTPSSIAARTSGDGRFVHAKGIAALIALFLGIAYVSETTFKPFIYFRF